MKMKPIIVSRIITAWMGIMTALMIAIAKEDTADSFYRFGPHPDLIILGYTIDTASKYALVIFYALVNTVVRNLNHNVITPWITLNIQDTSASADVALLESRNQVPLPLPLPTSLNKAHAYEISVASTLYSWFDWLIYIHMLMAQVDMVIIEMGADVLATSAITYWYLEKSGKNAQKGYVSIDMGDAQDTFSGITSHDAHFVRQHPQFRYNLHPQSSGYNPQFI